MKGLQNKSRIISVIITMLVILMLIISEPAGAVTVKVDTTNMPTTVGQGGYFYFEVIIGGNETIPVANFTIEGLPDIDGSRNGTLVFNASDVDTTIGDYYIKLDYKHGWEVRDDSTFGYFKNRLEQPHEGYGGYGYSFVGHGYGYGYGLSDPEYGEFTRLRYIITIDTTDANAETYDLTGKINTGVVGKSSFSSDSASTSSFTLKAEESKKSGSSGGSSKYSWVSSTYTPTATESEDATPGQPTPTKTVGEVSTDDVQETPTPTPTETEDGGLPGFTSIMFIAGLLAAAYIIIRKRG